MNAFDYFFEKTSGLDKHFLVGKENISLALEYNGIGNSYLNTHAYDKALENYKKALSIGLKENKNYMDNAMFYQNIAIVYTSKGDYDNAYLFFNKSVEVLKITYGEKSSALTMFYLNLGVYFYQRGKPKEALAYYYLAEPILKSNPSLRKDLGVLYLNEGNIATSQKDFNKALTYYQQSLKILKDEPMPYNVPKTLALWSVTSTVENARLSGENGIGVVHGSKYPDLRVECAKKLEELGNTVLMIANPEELVKRSRDLVDIIVMIRENINPNSAIYYPFAEPAFIPLLAYMGVDLFDSVAGDFYASLNILLTPSTKYDLDKYKIYDMNLEEIKDYNKKTIEFTIKEVQEHIKNGTLRNLIEERSCSSPEAMTSLRILDRDYKNYIDKYTQLY